MRKACFWNRRFVTFMEVRFSIDEWVGIYLFAPCLFIDLGVRSRMEAGFKRLNDLTILMLTHGFAVHLKEYYKREISGVAIGFDGRHNSRRL